MRHPRLWFVVAVIALALAALTPQVAARPAQESKIKGAIKHPDLSGVWFMQGKVEPNLIPPEDAPLTPWGAEQFKINRQQVNPDAICLPTGVPKSWQLPAPFEIIPLRGRILIFHEHEHMVRRIHMDRSEHPKDLIPTWMGNSIGRWDGDTLVVDTTGFNEQTWVDLWGLPHSAGLHVIERIRRINPTVLQVQVTIDDPKAYTKQWTAQRRFSLKPDWEIGEEICEENNDYLVPSDKARPEN